MRSCRLVTVCLGVVALAAVCADGVEVRVEHHDVAAAKSTFQFSEVPTPAPTDAATNAKLMILKGRRDPNSGSLDVLHDGRLPRDEDQPAANFFFAAGSTGGRLVIDLGTVTDVRTISSYSWHPGSRGPQVYRVFAADGAADGFDVRRAASESPDQCGWLHLADVDTRPETGDAGGQYGVVISNASSLGKFRYLLFDVASTEDRDAFGNTFFSEIDVDDGQHHEPTTPVLEPRTEVVSAGDGKYQITIDTTESPDLTDWVHNELAPVVTTWYPRIVDLLASEGYTAPRQATITFSADMQGVAATSGTRVSCAANWMRRNLQGEAKGAVVHELVHVAQQYRRPRGFRSGGGQRTPGWLVEGIADYVRWYLYEPESKGAEISGRNIARARYDGSYRVSANFLNWATNKYDQDLVPKLNAAARQARYRDSLWKELTGHTLPELGEQWKAQLAE